MLVVVGVLVLLSVIIGLDVFGQLIAPAAPLNFDEAAHSLPGYYVLRDIRALDARAFWGDFHIQTLWPPGFSILQAPFLAVLGRTDDAARTFAYIMLVLTLLMACALAYEIYPESAPLAGLISGLISLSAPGWLFVSSWAMQETPVAFVAFVVFWIFLRALKTQQIPWFVLTGCGLFFLFLTKYNYAAFALATTSIVDLVVRIRRMAQPVASDSPQALDRNRGGRIGDVIRRFQPGTLVGLYAPIIVCLALWFFTGTDIASTDVKWRDFRFFVSNENSGYPFWSEQNLLFYVRATLNWLMPHPLLAIAIFLGAVWAVVKVRHRGVLLLAVYFGLGFVLATVHQLKAERYITPLFPSLWLLAGIGITDILYRLARRQMPGGGRLKRIYSLSSVAVVFAIALASWVTALPRLQPVWAGNLADDLRAASNQITAWQQGDRPVLIIGTFGELSPPLFEWRLRPLPAFRTTPYPVQYDAPPVDGPDDIARVSRWLTENPGAQVTLIRVDPSSPLFQTDDMKNKNAWRQDIVRHWGEVKGYTLVSKMDYPRSGVQISYWLPVQK